LLVPLMITSAVAYLTALPIEEFRFVELVLDDLSAVAVTDGDLQRAARLRGAARQLTQSTGTELARLVDEMFEQATRPNARVAMEAGELERLEVEGGGLALDTAVAYALGEADPFEPGARPGDG